LTSTKGFSIFERVNSLNEDIARTSQILWNLLTNPVIRDRVLAMRHVFTQHQQNLGYIALQAMRKS
jgi:hypothetical protein